MEHIKVLHRKLLTFKSPDFHAKGNMEKYYYYLNAV